MATRTKTTTAPAAVEPVVDVSKLYRMNRQGTQYSEPGFGLAWAIEVPAQVKKLPGNVSRELGDRIRAGVIVEASEADAQAWDDHVAKTQKAYISQRQVEAGQRRAFRGENDLGGTDRMTAKVSAKDPEQLVPVPDGPAQ